MVWDAAIQDLMEGSKEEEHPKSIPKLGQGKTIQTAWTLSMPRMEAPIEGTAKMSSSTNDNESSISIAQEQREDRRVRAAVLDDDSLRSRRSPSGEPPQTTRARSGSLPAPPTIRMALLLIESKSNPTLPQRRPIDARRKQSAGTMNLRRTKSFDESSSSLGTSWRRARRDRNASFNVPGKDWRPSAEIPWKLRIWFLENDDDDDDASIDLEQSKDSNNLPAVSQQGSSQLQ